jgi:putative tryptophan/tyrosine transport system substrate-binding protein
MQKRIVGIALGAVVLALGFPAEAQQAKKMPQIGYLLTNSRAESNLNVDVFRRGLRDLGYVEGRDVVIQYRSAEGKLDRLPELAVELVRLKVDVIVTPATTGRAPLKKPLQRSLSSCQTLATQSSKVSWRAWRDQVGT